MDVPALRALLDTIAPFDDREAGYRDRIMALLGGLADPFSRTQFEPGHVTASGFVLSPDRSAILLVLHRKLGRWLQPGGHIEPGDQDIVAAQRREIEEETGICDLQWQGVLDLDVHTFPRRGDDPAHEHFDVRSVFVSGDRGAVAGDGTDDVRWFRFDEIPRGDLSITRPIAKLRSLVTDD
ncbi:NUDIX domain protein [bacterium BMS3Abin02]|nr:NUDIX domain protein [bacterium BMS3Abin02]GBE21289.1 NUDIX domain protein [bacterium BMS3Bbin01]HDH25316.1 NUDIX domain-containing protein [Actinomycetota bacterium]HDK46225.1 NUDIX domain-containing protein [Actinomycetota bacterium]HDL49759.1 NUDIX domain-containing protein [Actinomycetota bacterium]